MFRHSRLTKTTSLMIGLVDYTMNIFIERPTSIAAQSSTLLRLLLFVNQPQTKVVGGLYSRNLPLVTTESLSPSHASAIGRKRLFINPRRHQDCFPMDSSSYYIVAAIPSIKPLYPRHSASSIQCVVYGHRYRGGY